MKAHTRPDPDPAAAGNGLDLLPGYRSAREGAAVVNRSTRRFLIVSGRAPGRMLTGLITGSIPPDLGEPDGAVRRGRTTYSALLTPRGKLVSDLRVARLENGEDGALLLEFPQEGFQGAVDHMRKYLPPRFAQMEEPSEPIGVLTVIGPRAPEVIEVAVPHLPEGDGPLEGLEEGDELVVTGEARHETRVVRHGDVTPPAWDILAPVPIVRDLEERLGTLGAASATPELWETLRVERGRPAFGRDLDAETLLPEAGIGKRAIDDRKGCYTGQEVIVRIRDRGKVNRLLRGLLLGRIDPPAPGTPLFHPDRDGPAGEIRSAVRSPRFAQAIALAYVRREVEPPATVRIGAPDGPNAWVRALDEMGWVLVEGDAPSIA